MWVELAFGALMMAAPPVDVKAAFGEEVAADIESLKTLKAQGPVDGAGRCLKVYMEAVQFEKDGNARSAVSQFRACAASCADRLPAATIPAARDIAQKYARVCREKAGIKEPAPPVAVVVTRTKAAGACDNTKVRAACREYPKFGMRTEKDEESVCKATQGTWVSGEGCPEQGQVGACEEKGTKQIQRWYNHGPNKGTEAQARDACSAMMGRFIPPPPPAKPSGRPSAADLEKAAASVAALLEKKDVAGARKALIEKLGAPQRDSKDAGLTSWYTEVSGASCSELRLSDVGGGAAPKAKVLPAPPSECR